MNLNQRIAALKTELDDLRFMTSDAKAWDNAKHSPAQLRATVQNAAEALEDIKAALHRMEVLR